MSIKPAREKGTQDVIVAFFAMRGAEVIRVNGGAVKMPGKNGASRYVRFNIVGKGKKCSDALVCYRGRFIAAEIKRVGEVADAEQRAFLDAVTRAGGIGCVLEDVTDAERVLHTIDEECGVRS